MADLVRDQDILVQARQAAFDILAADPELADPQNARLKAYTSARGAIAQSRFETA